MAPVAGGTPAEGFRPAAAGDVDAMDALCQSVYSVSRKNETATIIGLGFPTFVLERGGAIRGYAGGTAINHGVAETTDDMLALLASMGAAMNGGARVFVPMRNGELYRRALAAGHRNVKVVNLMALGPYEELSGTCCPSVLY
jgi:hypothetical protein